MPLLSQGSSPPLIWDVAEKGLQGDGQPFHYGKERVPTIQLEALSWGVQGGLSVENCLFGKLTDADAWAAIMPEEETESLGGVRSQWRRCLASVDE